MSDIQSGDAVSRFIDQVAAVSWAATQVPEITVANQSFLKAGFFRAVHVELLIIIGFATSPSRYKWIWFYEFQDLCEILINLPRSRRGTP
jgi:hypothetical protein